MSLYFLTLSRLRTLIGQSGYFTAKGASSTGKVKLTTAGDLLVGSTARTGVGFLLMPFTLLKTLSEVRFPLPTVLHFPQLVLSPPPHAHRYRS